MEGRPGGKTRVVPNHQGMRYRVSHISSLSCPGTSLDDGDGGGEGGAAPTSGLQSESEIHLGFLRFGSKTN